MIIRRHFLQQFSAAALGGIVPQSQRLERLERIGLGLFTIPWLLEKDFAGTLKLLAQIGYKELEFYGPYPFSTPAAHERWKSVTAAVGFKGSGYFGLTGQQVRQLMKRHGLTSPSMHTDLGTLRERLSQLAEAAHVMGQRYVTLPAIPDAERPNLDAYKRLADEFNQIGANAAKAGVTFMYHNHGYGLVEREGQIPFQVLVERDRAPKAEDTLRNSYRYLAALRLK